MSNNSVDDFMSTLNSEIGGTTIHNTYNVTMGNGSVSQFGNNNTQNFNNGRCGSSSQPRREAISSGANEEYYCDFALGHSSNYCSTLCTDCAEAGAEYDHDSVFHQMSWLNPFKYIYLPVALAFSSMGAMHRGTGRLIIDYTGYASVTTKGDSKAKKQNKRIATKASVDEDAVYWKKQVAQEEQNRIEEIFAKSSMSLGRKTKKEERNQPLLARDVESVRQPRTPRALPTPEIIDTEIIETRDVLAMLREARK